MYFQCDRSDFFQSQEKLYRIAITSTGKRARPIKFKTPDDIHHPAVRALLQAAVNAAFRPDNSP